MPTLRAILQTTLLLTSSSLFYGGSAISLHSARSLDQDAWPQNVVPSCPSGRVLVIGAGVAGLTLASHLKEYGCDVLVLEASSSVGGRVKTKRNLKVSRDGGRTILSNGTVEMGAGWIHGSTNENPVYRYAHANGIPTTYVGGDSTYIGGGSSILMYGPDKKPLSAEKHLRLLKVHEQYISALEEEYEKIEEGHRDVPLCELSDKAAQKINASDGEDSLLLNWHFEVGYGGDLGTEACDLSALYAEAGLMLYPNGDSVFPHGYDEIPRQLAKGLNIIFNKHIVEVKRINPDLVQVTSTDGDTFRGAMVVVTASVGMLQSDSITFSPPLPDWKRSAIHGLKMGVLNRFAFSFPKPFWPSAPQYTIGYISSPPGEFPMMVSQLPITGNPVLELMVGGPKSIELEAMSDEEIKEKAMKLFDELFPGKVLEPIDTFFSRYGRDPLSRGAYSHIPPSSDGVDVIRRLSLPLWDGRLRFAGEATDTQQRATVAGAMRSGTREARLILLRNHIHGAPHRPVGDQEKINSNKVAPFVVPNVRERKIVTIMSDDEDNAGDDCKED